MQYQLLVSHDADDLTRQIEELMKQDWKPQGGIALTTGEPPNATKDSDGRYWGASCVYYVQAMVYPYGRNLQQERA